MSNETETETEWPTAHGHRDYTPGCEKCRAYQRERVRRNRSERLAEGRLNHGTRSAADTGCPCTACRGVRRKAYLTNPGEYPAKRKAVQG